MEKINAEEFTRTLTGFDELAIQRAFRTPFTELQGTMIPRALLFVQNRRNGAKDQDAYKAAMDLIMGDLEGSFLAPEDVDEGKASSPR